MLTLSMSIGFAVGALWWMLVLGICTALESYRFQGELLLGGSGLVLLGALVMLVRSFVSLERTVVQVSPEAITIIRPAAEDRTFPYSDIESVKFKKETLSGFHKVVDTTRVIEITTHAGGFLSVDIHNSWWGGVRGSIAKHLTTDRLGPLG